MREIVFDTETTGLSFESGDRLVEIGCIETVNRVETGRTFHCYFNPERPMPPEAQRIHGLSDAFLSDKPKFAEKADELLEFLGDSTLIAHNATFDFGFLNGELGKMGRQIISLERMVDTVAMARQRHPGAKHSLDALCTRYSIDSSHRVLHGALLDAQLLAQVYVELTGGRQIGMEFTNDPTATDLDALTANLDEAAVTLLRLREVLADAGAMILHGDIGHNRPPKAVVRETDEIISNGILAAAAASGELEKDAPNRIVLRLCLAALKRALRLLKSIVAWFGGRGTVFADEISKVAGKAVGYSIVVAVAHATGILDTIIKALESLPMH